MISTRFPPRRPGGSHRARQFGGMAENIGLIALAVGAVLVGLLVMARQSSMQVVEAVGQVIEKGAPPRIEGPAKIEGINGEPLSVEFTAADSNGTPLRLELKPAPLPAGLEWDGDAGRLIGTPTAPATGSLTLTTVDTAGGKAEKTSEIAIRPAAPVFTTEAQAVATLGTPFVLTFEAESAQPGDLSFRGFHMTEGKLPPGLRYNKERHRLEGTPLTTGRSRFALTALDSAGASTEGRFTLSVPDLRVTLSDDLTENKRLVLGLPDRPHLAAVVTLSNGFDCAGLRLELSVPPRTETLVLDPPVLPGTRKTLLIDTKGKDGAADAKQLAVALTGTASASGCAVPLVLSLTESEPPPAPDSPAPAAPADTGGDLAP